MAVGIGQVAANETVVVAWKSKNAPTPSISGWLPRTKHAAECLARVGGSCATNQPVCGGCRPAEVGGPVATGLLGSNYRQQKGMQVGMAAPGWLLTALTVLVGSRAPGSPVGDFCFLNPHEK